MAQLGIDTIAAAAGITVSLPTWNNVTAIGIIHIKPDYLTFFSDKEWQFIIAHECSHIFYNHSVSTLLWSVLEAFLKGQRKENEAIVELVKALFIIFTPERLPPNAVTLRDNEYMADESALRITNDIRSARSCLMKICNGNLDSGSHFFDLGAASCENDGLYDGKNNSFSQELYEMCGDTYYDAYIEGCMSVEGNTRDVCESDRCRLID
jgi:hypothetical protein